MDIIVVGASGTGKSALSEFLAGIGKLSSGDLLPIFNCDSIQVYKYLNSLTNKPRFVSQEVIQNEVVSCLPVRDEIDFSKYSNIRARVWQSFEGKVELQEFEEVEDLLNLESLEKISYCHPLLGSRTDRESRSKPKNSFPVCGNNLNLDLDSHFDSKSPLRGGNDSCFAINQCIHNFLFDICEPMQSYSTFDFEQDLDRISEKFKFKNKIIVGGTVYYLYNYLFQLNGLEGLESYKVDSVVENYSIDEMLLELEKIDPDSLKVIDIKNPRRIQSALDFIKNTGKKYSENYFKEHKLRDNFILIILEPKNREEYYKSLDKSIDSRFNSQTFDELNFLISEYGEEVIPWLQKISYEYKYFFDILFTNPQKSITLNPDLINKDYIQEILQVLKYKEHQYAKRQMTFLRRLERRMK